MILSTSFNFSWVGVGQRGSKLKIVAFPSIFGVSKLRVVELICVVFSLFLEL